jgi:hypothetical protein
MRANRRGAKPNCGYIAITFFRTAICGVEEQVPVGAVGDGSAALMPDADELGAFVSPSVPD